MLKNLIVVFSILVMIFVNTTIGQDLKKNTGIFVEKKNDAIVRLIPLDTKSGKEFDIKEWAKEHAVVNEI